jgi:tetratricopeptide (TPR) repeat protein
VGFLLHICRRVDKTLYFDYFILSKDRKGEFVQTDEPVWRERQINDCPKLRRATDLWRSALSTHLDGDPETAIKMYRISLSVRETAEAYTYMAWAFSHYGDLDLAIRLCKQAIDVDPTFGNAYNDMGAYLVEAGLGPSAETWFQSAKVALRYQTPQFPFLNLARLYISWGRFVDAFQELTVAKVLAPDDKRIGELITYVVVQQQLAVEFSQEAK